MNVAALDAVYIAVFFHCFSTFSSIGITFAQNDSNFGPNERLGVIRFYPTAIAIMRQTCSVPSNEKPIDFLSSYSIFFLQFIQIFVSPKNINVKQRELIAVFRYSTQTKQNVRLQKCLHTYEIRTSNSNSLYFAWKYDWICHGKHLHRKLIGELHVVNFK